MSLNPLNELKRRLDDEGTILPKRLCLAKNVIQSHHFPTTSKERVVSEWLNSLIKKNALSGNDIRGIIGWLTIVDDMTSELKSKLIKVVSKYLQRNPIQNEDVQCILQFVENNKISPQLTLHIDDYLHIIITLLQYLKSEDSNATLSERILNNLTKYYKESKRKLEVIIKLIDGENLETVFSYLDVCRDTVINVCQNILFPINKKSFFVSFLQTLIRKDNIDDLVAEKGDNIQSVLKIMSAFFTFPKGRTDENHNFLRDFIDVFVSCFCNESQMVFAFYVMVANSLNMNQSYLLPAMKMPPIIFKENDTKIKRSLFYNMLEILLKNEVDVNIKLTDTFGEKASKVEIKKNFMAFLQIMMMGQLKLEGKIDKTTLQIIEIALKLDPVLVEQKIDQILPPLMTAKKNNFNVLNSYIDMLKCLLEILFKLSRGVQFFNEILPHLKLHLEASNTEQFELKQRLKDPNVDDIEKLKSKIITGNDVFPQECVEMYGKLSSELMFRQNKEILISLQKDFEVNCLMMLEEGFVSPSIITLAEVLSAILSSFLDYNKMADHTVPRQVAEDFWRCYENFEKECLRKFGECILKLNYNPPLVLSFLQLCLSFSHLKLLNIKYGNIKLEFPQVDNELEVLDMSVLLPCLNSDQWIKLSTKIQEDNAVLALNNLLLAKTAAIELLSIKKPNVARVEITSTKTHLIKQIQAHPELVNGCLPKLLYNNLDASQIKQLSKILFKVYLNDKDINVFKNYAVTSNRLLLNGLVTETNKYLIKQFNNTESLNKALSKSDFNLISFIKDVNIKKYFSEISKKTDIDYDMITNCIELLEQLKVYDLEERYQLITIFVLLLLKRDWQEKKSKRSIDGLLLNIFELSPKIPDLYKIFPVDFIFSFEDRVLLDLLTLKIKTSKNFIIKSILVSAVNKVKSDSDVVKSLVDLLLSKQNNKKISSIEYFCDPVFQITCMILPLITKKKKSITVSAYRSILTNVQEKLHKNMLDSFKNIDFVSNGSLLFEGTGNIDDSVVENTTATQNAIIAYSLTLSKYCESNDAEDIKNLNYLWSGLEYFVQNAIASIQNVQSKNQNIDSSIHLLNVILRHVKKLDTHKMFQDKDKLFLEIWKSIVSRLLQVFENEKRGFNFDDAAVTVRFICELSSVECFSNNFVVDLKSLMEVKTPSMILNNEESKNNHLKSYKVSKYLWLQCLKANIIGPKCVALAKLMYQHCITTRLWIQENYEGNLTNEITDENHQITDVLETVDDSICELLRIDLDVLSEIILTAKKINLDYKFLDNIFELQHLIHNIISHKSLRIRCEVTWTSFFKLFEGCVAVLNNLIVSREELLEDRWPNYMQCYRALLLCLCERSTSHKQLEKTTEERLADIAHSIEKLTQSICKRKAHVSRIAAYTVADLCSYLERTVPVRTVRQHLENSVALLIQASDSTYAMAFLRRALAGSSGQMTMTNLYTMYKRYHKYVGNA